jgi:hypothetical protein
MNDIEMFVLDNQSEALVRLKERSLLLSCGCQVWLGHLNEWGYGHLSIASGKIRAHRAAYLANIGAIQVGAYVCHHCDNPACINPEHLFIGCPKTNMTDMSIKGRARGSIRKGEQNGFSKLTNDQVISIRKEYALGNTTQRELAEKFDVCRANISYIVRGIYWKDAA